MADEKYYDKFVTLDVKVGAVCSNVYDPADFLREIMMHRTCPHVVMPNGIVYSEEDYMPTTQFNGSVAKLYANQNNGILFNRLDKNPSMVFSDFVKALQRLAPNASGNTRKEWMKNPDCFEPLFKEGELIDEIEIGMFPRLISEDRLFAIHGSVKGEFGDEKNKYAPYLTLPLLRNFGNTDFSFYGKMISAKFYTAPISNKTRENLDYELSIIYDFISDNPDKKENSENYVFYLDKSKEILEERMIHLMMISPGFSYNHNIDNFGQICEPVMDTGKMLEKFLFKADKISRFFYEQDKNATEKKQQESASIQNFLAEKFKNI